MSNSFFDLQAEVKARLEAHEFLADIPMITEELGNVNNRIERSLAQGGVKGNDAGKSGIAILIITPSGRGSGAFQGPKAGSRSLSVQSTTIRVTIFVKSLINDGASGLQKAPLDVHFAIMQQMLCWDRGHQAGNVPIALSTWDSRETPTGDLSYFADYEFAQFINLQPTKL